jgi:endonuclease-3
MTGGKAGARKARPKLRKARARAFPPLERERATRALVLLRERYGEVECPLVHESPWQLLVATILSAQCTDARVNLVTPRLFARFPTPAAMAEASTDELEELIHATGFFRNKAKAIKEASRRLVEAYGGEVPRSMDDLLTLHGVARKTANVVRGHCWDLADGVVVDTHVFRVARRLAFSRADTAEEVEKDLMALFPKERWNDVGDLLIAHGRRLCEARRPRCEECPLSSLCPSSLV